jgi:hypothetical protein
MIVQPKALWGPLQLVLAGGGPSALIYTAPSLNSPILISNVTFCNSDGSAHTFSAYVVRSGGSLSNTNAIIILKSLAAYQSYTAVEFNALTLNPGDTIWANADAASKVNCIGSGWGA